jgi:mannose-6-phosphate isomerase-like protein (cupin superfamily)
MQTHRDEISPYITLDGSEIRELMHPAFHPVRQQSLAEAVIPEGCGTLLHKHLTTEELYHVIQGHGRMTLGEAISEIEPGDTVLIPPGTPHRVESLGPGPLRLLCSCCPAYQHEDTKLIDVLDSQDCVPSS